MHSQDLCLCDSLEMDLIAFFFFSQDFEFWNRDAIWFCQCLKNCVDSYCQLSLIGMCQLPVKGLWWENNLKHTLMCIHLLPIFAWSKLMTEGGISIKTGKGLVSFLDISLTFLSTCNFLKYRHGTECFLAIKFQLTPCLNVRQLKSYIHIVVFLIKPIDNFSQVRCYSRIATML